MITHVERNDLELEFSGQTYADLTNTIKMLLHQHLSFSVIFSEQPYDGGIHNHWDLVISNKKGDK